jgi:hypothetical protein
MSASQDAPNPASKTPADIEARLTTIMGTVQDGEKLTFVTEQRACKVDNPETPKGHEGHYVHAEAHVYPEKNSIHITEVKTPTACETRDDLGFAGLLAQSMSRLPIKELRARR